MTLKEKLIFELIQDLLVSTVLTIVGLMVAGGRLSFKVLIMEILFAWVVNVVIGLLVPEREIGEYLAGKLKIQGEKASFLVVLFVIVLINVLGITSCVVLKNVGINAMYWKVWSSLIIWLLPIGYISAMLFFPLSNRITEGIAKKI